jgi:hypothetical protein
MKMIFIPLKERETFSQRYNGTLGLKINYVETENVIDPTSQACDSVGNQVHIEYIMTMMNQNCFFIATANDWYMLYLLVPVLVLQRKNFKKPSGLNPMM